MTEMERRCRDNLSALGRNLGARAHDPKWPVRLLLRELGAVARDWVKHLDREAKKKKGRKAA